MAKSSNSKIAFQWILNLFSKQNKCRSEGHSCFYVHMSEHCQHFHFKLPNFYAKSLFVSEILSIKGNGCEIWKGCDIMKLLFPACYPFFAQEDTGVPFHRNFNSILRRDHQKNFLWASRLWDGRRKEPILSCCPEKRQQKNWSIKG